VCTLTILYKALRGYPIVALHNRYVRAGTVELAPRTIDASQRTYCPVDVASGGTWIGVNGEGLLVAVTNQDSHWVEEPGRSRGLLALDLLEMFSDAVEAKDHLLDPEIRGDYRWGNFVAIDEGSAWHVIWDRETECREIVEGAYAVSNLTPTATMINTERVEELLGNAERRRTRALELAENVVSPIEAAMVAMKGIAGDHDGERSLGSICYHDPSGRYMQSSSTLMAIADDLQDSRIHYCPGNPCEAAFDDYSYILMK